MTDPFDEIELKLQELKTLTARLDVLTEQKGELMAEISQRIAEPHVLVESENALLEDAVSLDEVGRDAFDLAFEIAGEKTGPTLYQQTGDPNDLELRPPLENECPVCHQPLPLEVLVNRVTA